MTTSSKFPIQLKYIPAHKGNIWNEITDSLAKEQRDNFDTLENNDSIYDQTQHNKKHQDLYTNSIHTGKELFCSHKHDLQQNIYKDGVMKQI